VGFQSIILPKIQTIAKDENSLILSVVIKQVKTMALDIMQSVEIIEALENWLENNRPEEKMRRELDIGYRIENQSVYIFEIRPRWDKPEIIHESPIAKTTYIHTKKRWKIFWMPSDMKWHGYEPHMFVKTIQEFLTIVEEDKVGCFWG
jgi:hypothetical protein